MSLEVNIQGNAYVVKLLRVFLNPIAKTFFRADRVSTRIEQSQSAEETAAWASGASKVVLEFVVHTLAGVALFALIASVPFLLQRLIPFLKDPWLVTGLQTTAWIVLALDATLFTLFLFKAFFAAARRL